MDLHNLLNFYKFANKQRDEFYNVKWRLVVALIIVAVMWFVNFHLQSSYPLISANLITSASSGTVVQASERMFNWFVTGFLIGFLAFAIMFEGEFLIASMKLTKLLHLREPSSRSKNKGQKKKK